MDDQPFQTAEHKFRETADADLEALAVARHATAALAGAVAGTQIEPAGDPAPPAWYLRSAILNLSVVALRSARGCMILVSSGYEPEAQGLKRRVSEIHSYVSAVLDDTSGQRARQWLEGPPFKPRKIVGKFGDLSLFDLYSEATHANADAITSWLTVPMPEVHEAHIGLIVVPHRRPEFSNAMLVELSHEVRDFANIMAKSQGRTVPRLADLDSEIIAARDRWWGAGEDFPEDP